MIPFCGDEISAHPVGTDFTFQLHGEINFHPNKKGRFPPGICLKIPIDSHWLKNFHKMRKFYKDICLLFLTDWRHMCRKNAIEITKIYWNIFLWIFSNWCVNDTHRGKLLQYKNLLKQILAAFDLFDKFTQSIKV